MPVYAGDAEQPLNLRRAGGEGQPLATLHRALVRGEDDPQAGGVDEMDVVEVEHNTLGSIDRVAFDRPLQPWRAEEIQFAMKRQHGPVLPLPDINGELPPHDHECSCYRSRAGAHTHAEQRKIVAQRVLGALQRHVLDVLEQLRERESRRLATQIEEASLP
jgi:hypothetical protein